MCDQQGANAVGCYGAEGVRTERIDALAAQGTRFERAYTACPVCTPGRAGLHTGMYPHANGAWANALPLDANTKTLGQRLAVEGYRCAHVGKWHLDGHDYFGTGTAPEPFDDRYWYDGRRHLEQMPEEMRTVWRKKLKSAEAMRAYNLDETFTWGYHVARLGAEFIAEAATGDEPFFLVTSFDEPHGPSTCPAEDLELFQDHVHNPGPSGADDLTGKPEHQQEWAAIRNQTEPVTEFRQPQYFACNHFVDRLVGRVIDAVDQHCADNTWVIYTTDHGDFLGAHWLGAKGPAMYDEITRVPFIVRPPEGQRQVQVVSEPVSTVDITPTVLNLAGISPPPIIDGKDLCPAINSGSAAERGDVLVEWNRFEIGHDGRGGLLPIRCLVRGQYKFVINLNSSDEFYDHEQDPHECTNLIYDENYTEIRDTLHDALLDLMDSQRDPFRGPIWERRAWRDVRRRGWIGPGTSAPRRWLFAIGSCLPHRLTSREQGHRSSLIFYKK